MNANAQAELDAIERDVLKAMIRQVDYLENKLKRKKALAEVGDAVTNAGLSWDQSERTLVFYASRFTGDRPDKVGDVIDPAAFDDWYRRWMADPLAEYPNTHGRLPIVVAHQWSDLSQVIGWAATEDVTIDAKGLLVAAHLFDTPEAQRTWEVARDLGLGASFAFDVAKGGERRTHGYNLITKFSRIDECGPCLLGAEPTAGTRGVKSDDRVLAEFKSLAHEVAEKHGIKSGLDDSDLAPDYRCTTCGAPVTAQGVPEYITGRGQHVPAMRFATCASCGNVSAFTTDHDEAKSANRAIDRLTDYEYAGYEHAVKALLRKRAVTPAPTIDKRTLERMRVAGREAASQAKADTRTERLALLDSYASVLDTREHDARIAELDAIESVLQ